MTDANLMDADCIHGNVWWECKKCTITVNDLARTSMGNQLQFSFHGSVIIDEVTRAAMIEDEIDLDNADDVAEWMGGHRELCALADTHDYTIV